MVLLKIMKIYKNCVSPKAPSSFYSSDGQCVLTVQRIVLQQSAQLKYKHVIEARNPIEIFLKKEIIAEVITEQEFSEMNQKGFILQCFITF